MGGACVTYGGRGGGIQGFCGETRWKETIWKTQAYMASVITMYVQKVGWGDMDWIDLAQDKDRW
jgi:hypothetical protein